MGTLIISGDRRSGHPRFQQPALVARRRQPCSSCYFRYGRTGQGSTVPRRRRGAGSSARGPPTSYRAYRQRRDKQAKWERRYRRERPLESRRQERDKGK